MPNLIIDKDHESDDDDDGFMTKEDDIEQPPPDIHDDMSSKVDEEDGEHGTFLTSPPLVKVMPTPMLDASNL